MVHTRNRSLAAVAEGELLLLVSNLLRNDCVFARVYVLQREEFDRLADNMLTSELDACNVLETSSSLKGIIK